ncbi:hypothetical protein GGI21_006680, partial [Coemansia aciculifera]
PRVWRADAGPAGDCAGRKAAAADCLQLHSADAGVERVAAAPRSADGGVVDRRGLLQDHARRAAKDPGADCAALQGPACARAVRDMQLRWADVDRLFAAAAGEAPRAGAGRAHPSDGRGGGASGADARGGCDGQLCRGRDAPGAGAVFGYAPGAAAGHAQQPTAVRAGAGDHDDSYDRRQCKGAVCKVLCDDHADAAGRAGAGDGCRAPAAARQDDGVRDVHWHGGGQRRVCSRHPAVRRAADCHAAVGDRPRRPAGQLPAGVVVAAVHAHGRRLCAAFAGGHAGAADCGSAPAGLCSARPGRGPRVELRGRGRVGVCADRRAAGRDQDVGARGQ